MRLHKLKLRNFISHVNTEIDFEEIMNTYDTNFILISGNTGSGKSSILDGLIVSLYGLGSQRTLISGREPLSDYASSKQWETEIEFSISGKKYKIVRKGSVATYYAEENGKMKRITETPPLPIKDGKLARKVMVIPQGEYMELLTAKKKDRQNLLLELIDIKWIDKFIQEMKTKEKILEKELKHEITSLKENIINILISMQDIDVIKTNDSTSSEIIKRIPEWINDLETIDPDKEPSKILDFIKKENIIQHVENFVEELKKLQTEISQEKQRKQKDLNKLKETHTKIETLLQNDIQDLSNLLENLRSLEQKRELISNLEKKLRELNILENLFKDLISELDNTQSEIYNLSKEIDKTQKEYSSFENKKETAERLKAILDSHLQPTNERTLEIVNILHSIVETLKNGETLYSHWQDAERNRKNLENLISNISEMQKFADLEGKITPHLDTIKKLQTEITDELQKREQVEKKHQPIENNLKRAKNELQQLDEKIKNLHEQKEKSQKYLEKLKTILRQVEQELEQLETNYYDLVKAELVKELEEGKPCPICGSTHHPNPASIHSATNQDMQTILKQRNEKKNQRRKIQDKIENVNEILEKINNDITLYQDKKHKIQSKITELEKELTGIKTELSHIDKTIKSKEEELKIQRNKLDEIIQKYGLGLDKGKSSEEFAKNVIVKIQADWKNLLNQLHILGISLPDSELSSANLNAIKDEINKKINQIETIKQQYETWLKNFKKEIEKAKSKHQDLTQTLNEFHSALQNEFEKTKIITTIRKGIELCNELSTVFDDVNNAQTIDFSIVNTINDIIENMESIRKELQNKNSEVQKYIDTIRENVENLKGKLETLKSKKQDKESRKEKLENTIEKRLRENSITDTIEQIRKKLEEIDNKDKWQNEVTTWKTERKSIYQNLINKMDAVRERVKEVFNDEIPNGLPNLREQELVDESVGLNELIGMTEQWETTLRDTINSQLSELANKIRILENEIKQIEESGDVITQQIGGFKQQNKIIRDQRQNVEKAIKKFEKFKRLKEITGVEESRKRDALPSLKTWIYQFIMDKMLQNASPYLQEFTDGRLNFYIPENSKHETIQIIDYTYGKVRNVNDLSGGEKFMTALSLALGLTDLLMQFERNASRPKFMFIDEGFGTLDAERLEKVVAQLKNYAQKHDILLGVISHRQEMHALAPVRIHVTHDRTRHGSKIHIIAQ